MLPLTYLEVLLPSFASIVVPILDLVLVRMETERSTLTPEPAEGSQAPLTPPSEPHSVTLSSRSPRVIQRQKSVQVEQTPLQAISHGILMDGIPTFDTFEEHRRHILIHMAATFRDWSRKGFTEGQSGHISVKDPEYDHCIWMNPLGKHFGLMTAGDFICLDMWTGEVVGGNNTRPANKAGFLIHSEIHKARPDVHAICHAHTDAGRAWSAFAKPLDMLNQDICNFYGCLAVDGEYGGIVFGEEEGRRIAGVLGESSKGAILKNHGLLTIGHTVDEAGFLLGLLERGCRIQLDVEAASAGNPSLTKHIIPDEEAAYNFKMASEEHVLYREAQPDLDYIFEMEGWEAVARGVENMVIDKVGDEGDGGEELGSDLAPEDLTFELD